LTLRTKLLNEHEDVLARTLRIRHARGSLETPAFAVNAAKIDQKLVREDSLQGIVEVSVTFRPEQLESMSRDNSLQQRFEYRMNSLVGRIPPDQLVVAVPLLEGKQGIAMSADDAVTYGTYVAELISNPRVDVVCTPVFHRVAEPLMKVIVDAFLHTMTSYNVSVALSVPYASRGTREELVETYLGLLGKNNRMLLNFLCVDYNASNPISKYTLHNYVLRYVQILQREVGELVAVYGVNMKYSRVARKYDELPARDLAAYFAQVDAFGENHKRRNIPGEVAKKITTNEAAGKQKLLNRIRYTYISLGKILENPALTTPETKSLKTLIEGMHDTKHAAVIINRLNIISTLNEANTLKQLFSGKGWKNFENPVQYLKSKEITRIDNTLLQRLEKFTKTLKPKTRKLDEYTQKKQLINHK